MFAITFKLINLILKYLLHKYNFNYAKVAPEKSHKYGKLMNLRLFVYLYIYIYSFSLLNNLLHSTKTSKSNTCHLSTTTIIIITLLYVTSSLRYVIVYSVFNPAPCPSGIWGLCTWCTNLKSCFMCSLSTDGAHRVWLYIYVGLCVCLNVFCLPRTIMHNITTQRIRLRIAHRCLWLTRNAN